jgi:hypothetical protein
MPSSSPPATSAPTNPMLSTGLARSSSSGITLSQLRSVASRRSRRSLGIASSTRSAARSKSSAASAWSIASDSSPFCSYQMLARSCLL